jgi:hypothetical protein
MVEMEGVVEVDKTTGRTRSAAKSPKKEQKQGGPLFTPSKALFTAAQHHRENRGIDPAHIENIQRIAAGGGQRANIAEMQQPPQNVEVEVRDLVDLSSSKSSLYRALVSHGKSHLLYSTHLYRSTVFAAKTRLPRLILARGLDRREIVLVELPGTLRLH